MKSALRLACWLCLNLAAGEFGRAATVGGMLAGNTVWSPAMNPVHLTNSVTVPSGATLTVQAGTLVRMTNGVSLAAQADATIDIAGTADNPVLVFPGAGTNAWGTINGSGNNSYVTIRHAELANGGINFGSRCTGLVEDSYVHDVRSAIGGSSARFVTLRRVHVKNYGSVEFNNGIVLLAEDSLFEGMTAPDSDALEIQNGPPGSIIRRCTFRHSTGSNSDAVDCNGSTNVFVHDCLIYDFSDKGCSFGTATAFNQPASVGMIVSNCLIYRVDTGLAVKDKSTASIYHDTLADCTYGVRLYQKYNPQTLDQGGHISLGWNNLIWGNGTDVLIATNSRMTVTYSDIGGTNMPGTGNLNADPLFLNAVQADYRLAPGSPALGAGKDSANLGAQFPVGAPMALSHPRIESATVNNGVVHVRFWADSEKSYTLSASDAVTGDTWRTATNVPTRPLPVLVEYSAPAAAGGFFRLQTP